MAFEVFADERVKDFLGIKIVAPAKKVEPL